MLADMIGNALHLARLGIIIDQIEDIAGRVSETNSISPDDAQRLAECSEHLQDFRPGGRKDD